MLRNLQYIYRRELSKLMLMLLLAYTVIDLHGFSLAVPEAV